MEIQPPKSGSMAPPPGTGERGFEKLQTPGGVALIGVSILLFAWICYLGSKWVRAISRDDKELRRDLKSQLQARESETERRESHLP